MYEVLSLSLVEGEVGQYLFAREAPRAQIDSHAGVPCLAVFLARPTTGRPGEGALGAL